MEVISKECEKCEKGKKCEECKECEKFLKEWFKEIFNTEEEIKDVIIYSHNEKIYEISFNE